MAKIFRSILLLTLSWFVVANSEEEGGKTLPCIQKLMPCQPYLNASSPPPSTCCVPMKELVEKDKPCMCKVFNDPVLLQSFNVTQDQGLRFVKSCGATVDPSACKKVTQSPTATPSPLTNNASPTHKSAGVACATPYAGGFIIMAAILISLIN